MKDEKLTLSSLIYDNAFFFIPFIIILFFGIYILAFLPKETIPLFLNQNNSPALDSFFKYFTFFGDGLFVAILLIPLAMFRVKYSLFALVSFLISGGIAQLFKRIWEMPRPKAYFTNIALHYVPGVSVYSAHSFPSGHTTTAFCLFLYLSIISESRRMGIVYFFCALLVAISRIYLLQHFFLDVYVGSIIGSSVTIILFLLTEKSEKLKNLGWFNQPAWRVGKR